MTWQGEKAWESTSSGWTAIVSAERARLVALMPAGGRENLLFASSKDSISWGGHRCWLGPQEDWKTAWPPPVDWEASAAAQVNVKGALLVLTHQHTDAGNPQILRSYEWRDGVLHCCMCWSGARRHAIQIIQVPLWSVVRIQRSISSALPQGYALVPIFGRGGFLSNREFAACVGNVNGDRMTLWHAGITEKVAVLPQDIVAVIGNYKLTIHRGEDSGVTAAMPDHGMLTQVFLGDWQNPFVELEQLSPFSSDAMASSEILIIPSGPEKTESKRTWE